MGAIWEAAVAERGADERADSSPRLWPSGVRESLGGVLASAASGRPSVLMVEGEPGMGKTTLLDGLSDMATGFTVLVADGVEGRVSPYAVFEQWGVATRPGVSPFVAAQQLRAHLDQIAASAPVLVRLDDLQWADPESVEALIWLLRRASGDRLLVAAASRPLRPDQHPHWQRLSRVSSTVVRVTLTGLTEEQTVELVRRDHPALSASTAQVLWRHTGGNPLYLGALLAEYRPDDVVRMRVLPAPSQFEALVADRLRRLDDDAITVVRSCAVLGNGWVPLPILAAVAGVDDILDAADRAVAAGLIQLRDVDGKPSARIDHALTRSAVYYATPLRARRELHVRAATVAPDVVSSLEHRVQACVSFDDELAAELESSARLMHSRRSYRLAGQLLDSASAMTGDHARRERLRLDAMFERQLARQRGSADADMEALPSDADPVRIQLLRGHAALLAGHPAEAVRRLGPISSLPVDPADPLPHARAGVLLASAHMRAGASAGTILGDLDRARQAGPTDPALGFMEFYPEAIARLRGSNPDAVLDQLGELPDRVSEVPLGSRNQLSWRGMMRVSSGLLPESIPDLREAYQRIVSGEDTNNISHGGQLATLGLAQWFLGRWDLTRVAYHLVEQVAPNPLSLVQVYLSLLPSGAGDLDEADRRLGGAVEVITEEPWQESVQALLMARVIRAHAGDDPKMRRELLSETRRRWPEAFVDTGLVSSLWFLHSAQAAIWAGELDLADEWIGRLETPLVRARWALMASGWLRGLAAERAGLLDEAFDRLAEVTRDSNDELPFYRAHALTDYARVAAKLDRKAAADTSYAQAQRLYRTLGASTYVTVASPPATRQTASAPDEPGIPPSGPWDRFGLSEREEDVATLVADGMSYAQVAQELFITRSTVGFHLGNIYAKVGVSSRHALAQQARTAVRTA